MACNKPIQVWQRYPGATLDFRKPRGRVFRELKIDCTKCLGCRKRYKQEWTARVLLEDQLQEHGLFTTLTYDAENVPDDWGLPYRDVQLYHKRIRNMFGIAPRFVNVGEYGEEKGRPHWHELMWGINPGDLKPKGKGSRGDQLYGSKVLDSLWQKGGVRVGELNAKTAAYVVGYHLKSLDTKREGAYDFRDPDTGEWFTRENPRMRTSRNPGIAAQFYEMFPDDIWPKGYVTKDGKKLIAPRYYLNKLEKHNPQMHAEVVAQRAEHIQSPEFEKEHTVARLKTKERLLEIDNNKRRRERAPIGKADQEAAKLRMPRLGEIEMLMAKRQQINPNLAQLVRGLR